MAAILARKLGMTQIFGEDGAVARVTVLAAGPCHVTAIRTAERDGYDAVQLAFGAVREKALTKPELGHLAKADAPPLRHLVEFRGEGAGLAVGETVDVARVRARPARQGLRDLEGQGLPGHDQAPPLQPRARRARLAQRPRPRLDRRLGDARRASFKGIRGPGQMGNKRVTQRGLEVVAVRAGREPAVRARRRCPGPRNGYVEVRSDG